MTSDKPVAGRIARAWLMMAVLVGCCGFLYLQVFVLPNVPRYAYGDQNVYLNHAARMVDGELIYRDFDHFTLPGTDVLYTLLFRLLGVRVWISQAMLVVVGVLTAWLMVVISRTLLQGSAVFLPAFLFVTLPFSSYLDATHHWYSSLAAAAAVAVVIEKRTDIRVGWAGFLWGIATYFTQTVALGGLGLALFLAWEARRTNDGRRGLIRKELVLFSSLSLTVGMLCAYFFWKVGLKRFLYFTVVFVAKYYSADDFNTWRVYLMGRPPIRGWMNWPNVVAFVLIYALIPLIYVVFLFHYRSEQSKSTAEPWDRLMLVNITGACLFVSVANAPAFSRLCTVSWPALILLVWFLKARFGAERVLLRMAWATVLVIALIRPIIAQIRPKQFLELPTGRAAFIEPMLYEKCKWVSDRTHPFDYFAGDHDISFPLRLRTAGRVSFVRPTDYTRPEEVDDMVQALEKHHVRYVSWYRGLYYEGIPNPAGDHLDPLRRYLHQHYHVATVFSNQDEIWERNE